MVDAPKVDAPKGAPAPPFALRPELLERVACVPLADSELHLVAHYLPVCVRLAPPTPLLCAVLAPSLLQAPLTDAAGAWSAPYRPLAVRCLPFRHAGTTRADQTIDLHMLAPDGNWRPPRPALLQDSSGVAHPYIVEIQKLLRTVQESSARLLTALDQLQIAGLLHPLEGSPYASKLQLHTIDSRRFDALNGQALAALSRQSFAAVDLAGVILFSQRRLRADVLGGAARLSGVLQPGESAPAEVQIPPLLELSGLALDAGDLVAVERLVSG